MVPLGFTVHFLLSVLIFNAARENFTPLHRFLLIEKIIYPFVMGVEAMSSKELYSRNYEYYDGNMGVYSDYGRRPSYRVFSEMLEPEEDKRILSTLHGGKFSWQVDDDDDDDVARQAAFRNGFTGTDFERKSHDGINATTENDGLANTTSNDASRAATESPLSRILPNEASSSRDAADSGENPGNDTVATRRNMSPQDPPRYISFFNDPFLWRMPEVPSRKSFDKNAKPEEARADGRGNDTQIVKIKSKSLPGSLVIYGERSSGRKLEGSRRYKGIDRKPWKSPIQSTVKSGAGSSLKSTRKSTSRRNASETRKTKPEILSLKYDTVIRSRYARTTICGCLRNYGETRTININAIMPQASLITKLETNVSGGRTISSSVRGTRAVRDLPRVRVNGEDIGTFLVESRDSEAIVVPVVVPKERVLNYSLSYEYLLRRELGVYSVPVFLHSNRWIKDLTVKWQIIEERNITKLYLPRIYKMTALPLKSTEDSIFCIDEEDDGVLNVLWKPSIAEQRNLSTALGPLSRNGLVGVLKLEYDVDHSQDPCGQVVKEDSYFAQFYAALNQPSLSKHIVFILDLSDSMQGEPIKQLKKAMVNILDTLQATDKFTLIDFSDEVQVMNIRNRSLSIVYRGVGEGFGGRGKRSGKTPWPGTLWAYEATQENILAAKNVVMDLQLRVYTNIYDALLMGYKAIKDVSAYPPAETGQAHPEPIIIFLTDGRPNDGPSYDDDVIVKMVEDQNSHAQATMLALGFGPNADMGLLRRFALATNGIDKHIYKDSDAADQLLQFFESIQSPIFKNVYFKYNSKQVDTSTLTEQAFPIVYKGREIVLAGKLNSDDIDTADLYTDFVALGRYAVIRCENMATNVGRDRGPRPSFYKPNYTSRGRHGEPQYPAGTAERIWAYSMLRQLRDVADADHASTARQPTECDDQLKPNNRMLEICLRLNYAMPTVTSLVYDGAVVERISVSPEIHDATLSNQSMTFDSLRQFSWLLRMRDKHGFAKLPIISRNKSRMYTYLSLGVSQQPRPRRSCAEAPDGAPGECRYLPECPDPQVLESPAKFRKYFCRLGSYAGVCCSSSFLAKNVTRD